MPYFNKKMLMSKQKHTPRNCRQKAFNNVD